MASKGNKLTRIVSRINDAPLPNFLKSRALSFAFNSQVKMAWTCGIQVESWDRRQATVNLKNRMRVRNHIGGIHACGMAILAESSTGMVFGINVPEGCIPLLKSMDIKYKRRAMGDLQAVATLSPEKIELMQSSSKGEVSVDVCVKDSEGKEPCVCNMIWAWTKIRSKM